MFTNNTIANTRADLQLQLHLEAKQSAELSESPEGSLCRKNERGVNRYYWRKPADGKGEKPIFTYLSASLESLKIKLVRKRFLERSLKKLRRNIKYMKLLLKYYSVYDPDEIASDLPPAYKGIAWDIKGDAIEANHPTTWADGQYTQNQHYPDSLLYTTTNGVKVRSKSEVIIAEHLDMYKIPFRYEAELILGPRKFYPDFTILNPKDNQIVYWEHFGMIDNSQYARNAKRKLAAYAKYNIKPCDNLILTYEGESQPIDLKRINSIIKAFITD